MLLGVGFPGDFKSQGIVGNAFNRLNKALVEIYADRLGSLEAVR